MSLVILTDLATALLVLAVPVYLGLVVFMVARWWQTRPAASDRQPVAQQQRQGRSGIAAAPATPPLWRFRVVRSTSSTAVERAISRVPD